MLPFPAFVSHTEKVDQFCKAVKICLNLHLAYLLNIDQLGRQQQIKSS